MRGSGDIGCTVATPLRNAQQENKTMTVNLTLAPLISLIAGILILLVPRLLNYIVAIYLIVIGLVGIFGAGNMHLLHA
jgi:Protein of unknown function (DUF3096)